jgi:hypothetical protein
MHCKSHTEATKEKIRKKLKGGKFTDDHKRNISLSHKGQKQWNTGKTKYDDERIAKHSGANCNFWKGGTMSLTLQIRKTFKYRQWVSDVFMRDDFTCQDCGVRGGKLEAHHIKLFSKILKDNKITTFEQTLNCEELWNINNGRTLCRKCHWKYKKS